MRELKTNEIKEINGGSITVLLGLLAVLVTGKDQLNDIGKEIGAGIYDAMN